jgi:hypothetical protein
MYGTVLANGGDGFYESLLIVSYIVISVTIFGNMLLAAVLDGIMTAALSKQKDDLLDKMQIAGKCPVSDTTGESASQSKELGYTATGIRTSERRSSVQSAPATAGDHSAVLMPELPLTHSLKNKLSTTASLQASNMSMVAQAESSGNIGTAENSGTVLRRIGPWREIQGDDGDIYYWNKFTGVVTWTHPKKLTADSLNPAITSVAAALHSLNARNLKHREDANDSDCAVSIPASDSRRTTNLLRSDAELGHFSNVYAHAGGESAVSAKSSPFCMKEAHPLNGCSLEASVEADRSTKLSSIEMWYVRV